MTIAEKYKNLKNKTIKEMVLEIVENCAQNCKEALNLFVDGGKSMTYQKPIPQCLILWQASATMRK